MRILIIVIFSIFSVFAHATAIDGQNLFKPFEVQSVKFSPDTRYMLKLTLEKDFQRMYLNDMQDQKAVMLVELPDVVDARVLDFNWIDNNAFILNFKVKGRATRGLAELNHQGDKYEFTFKRLELKGEIVSYLEAEPDKILFSQDNFSSSRVDHTLYRVTTKQLKSGNLDDAENISGDLDNVTGYGYLEEQQRLWALVKEDKDLYVYERPYTGKQWRKLADIGIFKKQFAPIGLIDDTTLAVISNESTDKMALQEFNIETGKYGKVLYEHERYDLSSALLNRDGSVRSVSYFDHGRLVTEHFAGEDKSLQQQIQLALPGKQFIIVDEKSQYEDKLVLAFASNDPGSYYFFDRSAKELQLIGQRLPGVALKDLSLSEELTVTAKDGVPIEALLTRAKKPNGVLLVKPHGGPIGVQETQNFDAETQYLTSRGYAVLQVNFRGSSGYGKAFEQQGVGELGRIIEDDITAAVKHVRAQYSFDKMCAMGGSYGGYSALMLAMRYPEQYQCAIGAYGIYDLPFLYNASNIDMTEKMKESIEKVVGSDVQKLKDVSPFYMAEKLKVPFLLIAGKKDEIAWFEHSNRLKYRLEQLGIEFEHYFYPNVRHGHTFYIGDRFEMAAIDEFLRRKLNLPPLEDEGYQAILAEEYMVFGDAWNDGLLGKDSQKAFDWYRKGAELGNPRGLFNVGSYYHRGEVVELDMAQAKSWYEKAAEKGSDSASYRLGELYRNGRIGEVDHQQSVKYFEMAKEQGHKQAVLELALADCTGRGVELNFDKCIETLSLHKKKDATKKDYFNRRWNIVGELFWHESLSQANRQKLIALIETLKDIKVKSAKVEVDNWGTYIKKYTYVERVRTLNIKGADQFVFRHEDTTNQLQLNEGESIFGVRFDINGRTDSNEKTLLMAKWTMPRVVDCQVVGEQYRYEVDDPELDDGGAYYIRNLNKAWEKEPFNWRIEVQNLNGEKIFDKVYHSKGGTCESE